MILPHTWLKNTGSVFQRHSVCFNLALLQINSNQKVNASQHRYQLSSNLLCEVRSLPININRVRHPVNFHAGKTNVFHYVRCSNRWMVIEISGLQYNYSDNLSVSIYLYMWNSNCVECHLCQRSMCQGLGIYFRFRHSNRNVLGSESKFSRCICTPPTLYHKNCGHIYLAS